jgi:hypothetical protein
MQKNTENCSKKGTSFEWPLFGIIVVIIAIASIFIYQERQVIKAKNLATINYAIKVIKSTNDNPFIPTLEVALIHDVVGWGFVTLADVGLTEKQLQQIAEDSRNRSYAYYKKDPLKIKELHKYHMEYVESMSEGKFKWTDTTTWPKYAYLVNGTTENWATLVGKEYKDSMVFAQDYFKKKGNPFIIVDAPKIESGQYASLSTSDSCIIVLPDDPKERIKFLVSGIYYNNGYNNKADYNGSAAIPSKIGSGTKYTIFDLPKKGQDLKIIVYKLTDEEFKNQK